MADLLFIGVLIAFFALAVGFVRLCDRIIGPDEEWLGTTTTPVEDDLDTDVEVAA